MNIYPNPTSGILNVRFNDLWKGNVDLRVLDIFGRNQYQSVIDYCSGNVTLKIVISNSKYKGTAINN